MTGTPRPGTPRELLTVRQSAVHLNVSERMIRRLIAERRVAFHKIGRHVRLDRRDLDELVDAGRVDTPTHPLDRYP